MPGPARLRLEARAFALMATRRALTQCLAGLEDGRFWQPVGGEPALGEVVREVWEREAYWLWPPEVPGPAIPEHPSVTEAMYALVRHRGVTEELLMRSTDADLDRIYVSDARQQEDAEPATLRWALDRVLFGDLHDAARMSALRLVVEPGWGGAREAWDNAAEAVAASRVL